MDSINDGSDSVGLPFLGRDEHSGGDVEIKFLQHWERPVQTELLQLASLTHPNIARFLSLETMGESLCLIYEFSPGRTLAQRLKEGPLPQQEAIGICLDVANALQAGHRRNVCHGWLCPRYVKLCPYGRVKVLSFGLAQAVEIDDEFFIELVWENLVEYLAFDYMAPEARVAIRPYRADPRSDIWSLGVMLYEMVVGKLPFEPQSQENLVQPKPRFPRFLREAPTSLRNVIERCLASKPNKRFQQVREVRTALQAVTQES